MRGHVHVVATDEHDEDSTLVSDEFTNPHVRRRMVEKRAKKLIGVEQQIAPPELLGAADAEVTLVGWGSSYLVIQDALSQLAEQGVTVNHLPIKWLIPLHEDHIVKTLSQSKKIIIVENNHSGQFARYLRGETGIKADAHIRKYDGEPFAPHHITEGVIELLKSGAEQYVPYQEVIV